MMLTSDRLKFFFSLLIITVSFSAYISFIQADPDLWGHTKFGIEHIQTGKLARTDPYSFTAHGVRWINHEWLSEWFLGKFYLWKGERGLFIFRSLIFISIILVAIFLLWLRFPHPFFFAFSSMLLIFFLSYFSNIRPLLFTTLFLLVFLLILELYHRGNKFWINLLPPLMLVWTNCHGGFVVGLVVSFLGLIFYFLGWEKGALKLDQKERIRIVVILALTFFITFLNPYGFNLYRYLAMALQMKRKYITEWQGIVGNFLMIHYALFTVISILIVRLRYWKRPTTLILFLIFAQVSFHNTRFMVYFIILAFLMLSDLIRVTLEKFKDNARFQFFNSWVALLALMILVSSQTALIFFKQKKENAFHVRVETKYHPCYPVNAVRFLKSHFLGPNLQLEFNWGEYAIWHLSDQYKVSLDGRYETVYPVELADRMISGSVKADLDLFLAPERVDVMMLITPSRLNKEVAKRKDWILIYHDDQASIYVPERRAAELKIEELKQEADQIAQEKPSTIFP